MLRSLQVLLIALAWPALASASRSSMSLPGTVNCTVPPMIRLVGARGGVPASAFGKFTVVVRDLANNPMPGASVVIDLASCYDLAVCADQHDPNVVVNCVAKTVRAFTGADGSVQFTLLGQGYNGVSGPSPPVHSGRVYGNGLLIGTPTIACYDLDGAGGVSINDLSVWLGDFGSSTNPGRSDFDGNSFVGVNDLSIWLEGFGSGTMIESCGASCP